MGWLLGVSCSSVAPAIGGNPLGEDFSSMASLQICELKYRWVYWLYENWHALDLWH